MVQVFTCNNTYSTNKFTLYFKCIDDIQPLQRMSMLGVSNESLGLLYFQDDVGCGLACLHG